jgi:hypothetical protein
MRTQTFAVSAAVVLLLCGSAFGQNALGDGRALDAGLNPQQGRVNPRASGLAEQLRFNNAVINGNAPGGMSFRGSTGYRAPDQFGGRVGSDTLYNFQRDSWTSAAAASGAVRGSDALRYQFALTTGQRVPGYLNAAPAGLAREGTVSTTANAAVTSLRSTSEFITGQSIRPSLVGVKQDEWGAEYVAKASPLLGVTWVKTTESPLGTNAAAPKPVVPVGTTEAGTTAPGGAVIPGTVPPTGAPIAPIPGAKPETGPVRSGLSGMESSVRGVQGALERRDAFDTRVKGDSTSIRNEVQLRVTDKFREAFADKTIKPDAGDRPEAMTFERQMDLLHRRLRGEPDPEAADALKTPDNKPPAPPSAPKTDKPEKNADTKGSSGRGGGDSKDDKERADRRKKDRASGLPDTQTPLTPEVLRAMRKTGEIKVDHLVPPAPAVGADAPDPDGYQAMMREGEELLSKGQFFGAEERFVRAIAAAAGDPMARAGRVHAEIGAGLYLSAATNLRLLISDHPELTAVRYADRLMPNADRAKVIAEQLEAEEKKAESQLGRESALLIAYVGYQRGDAAMVKRGLDHLANRTPEGEEGAADRALLAVVRAAWDK